MHQSRIPICMAWSGCNGHLDVPNRGAQFATDRIAPIPSDLKSHDSNRNPKFRSIRCDVLLLGHFKDGLQIARFES